MRATSFGVPAFVALGWLLIAGPVGADDGDAPRREPRPLVATSRPKGSITLALEAQRSYVHCVNGRVSSEQWDEEQMRVRHGSNVCQLRSFTSSSSAETWARSNFPSGRCTC